MHSITVQNIIIYTVADEIQKVSHPNYTEKIFPPDKQVKPFIKQVLLKGRNKRVK